MSSLGDKNIRRLNVSMHNPFGVRCIKGLRNLHGERQDQLSVHRPVRNTVLQRDAVQKFHGDEYIAMLIVNFVDGTNVRMIERRGSSRLAPETLQSLRILGHSVGQEFERHETPELRIFSLVDDAHAPAAELLDNAVMRDGLPYHLSRSMVSAARRASQSKSES